METVVEGVKEAVTSSETEKLSAEERAAKLGFAQHLPKDTEILLAVYNAEQAAEQLKALDIYKLIESEMGSGMGMGGGFDFDEDVEPEIQVEEDLLEDEAEMAPDAEQDAEIDDLDVDADADEELEGTSPWTLLGREITVAFGKSSGEQMGNLLTLNRRMAYFQAKMMGQAVQQFAKTGNMEDFSNSLMEDLQQGGVATQLLNDPQSGTALVDRTVMPPLTIAFRAKEGELEQAAQIVASGMSLFSMAGEMAEAVEIQTAGTTLSGYKLIGEKIAATFEEGREEMDAQLGTETVDALIKSIAQKNLFVVSGTIGEYAVLMIGGSEESLVLVTDPKDSIAATDELAFIDPFADKQLLSVSYGDNEVWKSLLAESGGISTYAIGLRDGIAGGGGLGETRDLEEMLQIVADREEALLALGSSSDFGMVAYTEDGLKVESFGGYDKGSADWDAKTTLSHLGDSSDNLLFFNAASKENYSQKMADYAEAIFETAYAVTMKISSLDIEAPELAEMKEFTQLFDAQFREDVVGLYEAIAGNFADGLGHESALVIDLKGTIPSIPGIPQKVVDEGTAPRITVIAPVKDRSKLAAAWGEMDIRSTSILSKVSEMAGNDFPMLKPMSSESNGTKTWFFSMAFFEDDFLPSVTVNDKWFAASTSKNQALDLIGKAEAGGETGNGLQFYVNFNALTKYADEMLDMVDKNSAAIFTNESDQQDFNETKSEISKVIEACRQFDSMNWTSRKEDGTIRNSVHFKVK